MLGAGKRVAARRAAWDPFARRRSSGPRCCWSASAWPIAASIARRNSPAASGSGPPWPGRSINAPDLLLADEPTGNLDRTTAQQVGQLLVELQKTEPMILDRRHA